MLELRWLPPDLRRLDEEPTEAFVLPFFEDERPLRGALGLVDWRLCGTISQGLLRGEYSGARGERVLIPGEPRLRADKLLLIGLGAVHAFNEDVFDEAVELILSSLEGLRVRSAHCVLPGRSLDAIDPGVAAGRFLRVAERYEHQDDVTLVDDGDAQRAIASVVEQERRRARALR